MDFGNGYKETISGFSAVCEVCGAEVHKVGSEFDIGNPSYTRKRWEHTVEYSCGAIVRYQDGFKNKRDYKLQRKCSEAHNIALDLKAKIETIQKTLNGKNNA